MTRPHTLRLSLAVALVAWLPAAAYAQAAAPSRLNPLRVSSDAMEALVGRVMPSVVQVVVTGYRPETRTDQVRTEVAVRRGRTVGSGVVIDSDGYLLTNAHVVENADRVQVMLARDSAGDTSSVAAPDARLIDARIVGVAEEIDLALLQVDVRGLPALPLADYAKVKQGELVFAFGSPDALRNSVSMGVVSAVAQQAEPGSGMVWIQTDAAVNPGNSGGPLVNVDGELLGLNTFIRSMSGGSEGLGFALPSAVIALAYPQLREYGHLHRALVGIAAQPLTATLRRALALPTDAGVIAADVAPGGPAAEAGVRVGDVITGVGGEALDAMSLARYHLFLLTLTDGQRVPLEVLRGGERLTLTATARVAPHRCERIQLVDLRANVIERLGIIGAAYDVRPVAAHPGLDARGGVIVMARVESTHAADLPLARGDVIYAVNGAKVTTPTELRDLLGRFGPSDAIVLQVERDGELSYVECQID